jgi:Spy/CpxP family protein refolding chaperone
MPFLLRKLPWALLAGSIAFNFAFLLHSSGGGALHPIGTGSQPATSPDNPRTSQPGDGGGADFERRLALDDQQKQFFAQLRKETQEKAKTIRQSMTANKKELMDLMAGDSSDPARIEDLIQQDAEYGRELRVLAMEHTAKLMRMLSPQQRQKMMEILRKRELAPMHGFGPNGGPTSRPFGTGSASRPFGAGPMSRPFDPEKIRHWQERREQMKDSRTETPTHGAPDPGLLPQTQPVEGT